MIKYIFDNTGITVSEEMQRKFDIYCDFLLAENEKYNLTAITEKDAVRQKHFADSILGSVFIPRGASLCDLGSGAGFPSLPLKIVRDDISVTLVDSLEKRINFTRELCERLNVCPEFCHSRAEDYAHVNSEKFNVVTARAVAPLPILLEYAAQAVRIGGIVLAYKTDLSEVESAQNACKILGLTFSQSRHFTLPDGSRRALLVFEKISRTPPKYPRGQNKPRKQPL